MKTIGHHSCSKDNGSDYVLQESPFFAEHNPKANKFQFLGSGYYLWDNNIELAKYWDRKNYPTAYYVVAFDIELKAKICLDLVGNRKHQIFLMQILEAGKINLGLDLVKDWTLNQLITFLKFLSKEDINVFPFKLIRAVDLLKHDFFKSQIKIKFISQKENYTIINPKIVIFAFDKHSLNLESKRIVYSS